MHQASREVVGSWAKNNTPQAGSSRHLAKPASDAYRLSARQSLQPYCGAQYRITGVLLISEGDVLQVACRHVLLRHKEGADKITTS